ncbi:MAG: zinc ribbon domain-containing protein [Crenarchaeota archaeon]|nr:MAG: zinc ribbon domain-containing protein [Thermoproteota archaeon]
MPIYEFQCKDCDLIYEELVSFDKTGKYKGVVCPKCESKKKFKLVSNSNFAFSNPEGTDRWNSDSQGHDYRFKYNLPNAKEERKMAEKTSKVGKKPYRDIDDISHGRYFGEVK